MRNQQARLEQALADEYDPELQLELRRRLLTGVFLCYRA